MGFYLNFVLQTTSHKVEYVSDHFSINHSDLNLLPFARHQPMSSFILSSEYFRRQSLTSLWRIFRTGDEESMVTHGEQNVHRNDDARAFHGRRCSMTFDTDGMSVPPDCLYTWNMQCNNENPATLASMIRINGTIFFTSW